MKNDYSKYLHQVVIIKKPLFEDGYLDKGMMGRIKSIVETHDEMVDITFDISEFHSFNVKLEERNWWNKGTNDYTATASEAGWYPKNHIDKYCLMQYDNLSDYFELTTTIHPELDNREAMLATIKELGQIIGDEGFELPDELAEKLAKYKQIC